MALDFERAAELRDQVALLRRVQDQQSMDGGTGDVDVVAAFVNPGGACVHLISVRGGRVLGSKNFFPQVGIEEEVGEVMSAFLAQYFLGGIDRELPGEVIVNVINDDFPRSSTPSKSCAASRWSSVIACAAPGRAGSKWLSPMPSRH